MCFQEIQSRYRGIACAVCAFVAIGAFSSCSKDRPADPASTSRAVFDEQATCDASTQTSTVPASLKLMPWGMTLPCGKYVYKLTLRDANNNPLSNRPVTIVIYDADYPRYEIPSYQPNVTTYEHRISPGFARHLFTVNTDLVGVARFYINGGFRTGSIPTDFCEAGGFDYQKAKVYACYTEDQFGLPTSPSRLLKSITPSTPDLNNTGSVNAADQSLFLHDYFCQPANQTTDKSKYQARSDFDGNNLINAADLSKMLNFINGPCGPEPEE